MTAFCAELLLLISILAGGSEDERGALAKARLLDDGTVWWRRDEGVAKVGLYVSRGVGWMHVRRIRVDVRLAVPFLQGFRS